MNAQSEIIISLSDSDEKNVRYFLVQYNIYTEDDEDEDDEYDEDEDKDEDEDDDDEEPDFFPFVSVTIHELTASDIEELRSDSTVHDKVGTAVCELRGWLIMADLIREYGYDPHDLCDEQSQDMEYCWAALDDESISAIANTAMLGNIFYVHQITIQSAYQPEHDESGIITELLAHIIPFVNDALSRRNEDEEKSDFIDYEDDYHIDVIAYYPRALPYDDHIQQMQNDLACGLVSRIFADNAEKILNPENADKQESEFELRVSPELYLRAIGMRVSGDTYPESAKNRKEWDLLEAAGWYECGNSRLLYKTFTDE